MTQPVVQPLRRVITQPMLDRYAEASGDRNPIHIDAAYAAATPLGGTIAHGMLVLALISEMMTAAFGSSWYEGGKLDVRFRAPSRPGDEITATAVASDRPELDGNMRYSVECRNQTGELLISGSAEVKA